MWVDDLDRIAGANNELLNNELSPCSCVIIALCASVQPFFDIHRARTLIEKKRTPETVFANERAICASHRATVVYVVYQILHTGDAMRANMSTAWTA